MRRDFVYQSRRRGIGLIEVGVVVFILVVLACVLLPQLQVARDGGGRRGHCRNEMRGLATALFNYQVLHGHYPGYMNALELADGKVYRDPTNDEITPVSWVVMILPDIDRAPLFDQWRMDTKKVQANAQIQPRIYIEQFLCPSDPQASKTGTPISFVLNTGMPDAPAATIDESDASRSTPRDGQANGMLFDNYSEHLLVKPDPAKRGPMIVMRDELVRDPKSRTIMLTENVDATNYTFDAAAQSANGWRDVEVQTGCIWKPGAFDASTKPPTMQSPSPSSHINVDAGKGDGKSYDYCRPSSRHPQSVNVAFVEVNVASLRDSVSYFVYAKLMASDDERVSLPGVLPESPSPAIDPSFRTYELNEDDINP